MRKRKGPHMVCPDENCHGGGTYDPNIKTCTNCGKSLVRDKKRKKTEDKNMSKINCLVCNTENDENAKFCMNCGSTIVIVPAPTPVAAAAAAPTPTPVVVAAVAAAPAPTHTKSTTTAKPKNGGKTMKETGNIFLKILPLAIIAAIFIVALKFLPAIFGATIWTTLFIVGLGMIAVAIVIATIFSLFPKAKGAVSLKWLSDSLVALGGLALVVALIVGLTLLYVPIGSNTPGINTPGTNNSNNDGTAASAEIFALGKPADADTIDQSIWNKPLEKAVMVDANGTTVYTQSGKDNSVLLKGQVPAGQALILDSYVLSKETNGQLESYSGGNVLVVIGPVDLDSNPISYTDGAAQMIGTTKLQEFLDSNIAVKFARGDWDKEKNQWSYKPWALKNKWLPAGYTFTKLTLTYATDTYPNRDTATIMTNNK